MIINVSENSPILVLGPTSLPEEEFVNLDWYLASRAQTVAKQTQVLQPQHNVLLILFLPFSSFTCALACCLVLSFQEREGEKDSRVNQATQETLG